MTRCLVLTADDLGRDDETSREIVDLASTSLITATTLIPVAPRASEAAAQIRRTAVTTRLHLTLTSEHDLLPWRPLTGTHAPSLVGSGGTLMRDPHRLGASGETGEVIAELEAQLAWSRGQGLYITAADSHAGTLYGLHGRSWLEPALRWCARHGLAFRLPRDLVPYLGGPAPEPLRSAHARAIALADELGVRIPQTMITNHRARPEWGSYTAFRQAMLTQLAALPEGISELFLHPTGPSAEQRPEDTRRWEARLLHDETFREAIRTEEITLVAGW
ncbi:ChbG/HpnK family deacetylase [Ruania halotolerans]|uniref:ChbG/HpnK family deacetylase n=1 Tax=Ruania halotolerans TaxID=2897773 RepID=UPI001E58249F|nr:ChbG/HpnK family deacetylase [Ruania halotolerans]UFU06691.1 ChbG/HpnK family deacetylase [Ruania halotolerans]